MNMSDIVNIHHDCDGVLRKFHENAHRIFFGRHPEYAYLQLPIEKFRGWAWEDQMRNDTPEIRKVAKKVDELMWKELFEDPEISYQAFGEAEAYYTPDEWREHVELIKEKYPNANIVISTHQYTPSAHMATMDFLAKRKFLIDDEISILTTGKKDLFGAHFLLDDKPSTIESFHTPYQAIGVLYDNPTSNGWYLRKHKKPKFPVAKNLADYREIIFDKAIELLD